MRFGSGHLAQVPTNARFLAVLKSDFKISTEGDAFPLDQARPGDEVVIESVDRNGSPAGQRLVDLGLLPDTPVRVIRRAPLGDPVEYALRGYRLCLRRSEAARIRVRRRAPERAGQHEHGHGEDAH